jgi:uncharacterized LabA/DUF88 family protein
LATHEQRVNIAVFIDFDNIEIGVKNTLGQHFDIGVILEALKERGEVVTKIAYADWTRAGEYSRALTQHAIRLVQRNLTPGGDKNGADINLALDALEMAFTHPHINAYVIVGGDSDFLSLVEKLKQYDKKVFVVGGRAFTSIILQRNCHEFIAYENLARRPAQQQQQQRGGRPAAPAMPEQTARLMATSPIAQAFPLVQRALKILADREVTPQTGLLKSTLLQLDSTFSERNYGASSFLDFMEKLAQAGYVQLKHAGRSVMVELNPTTTVVGEDGEAAARTQEPPAPSVPMGEEAVPSDVQAGPAPTVVGSQADGVAEARRMLAASTNARWPMYVRNVKQIFRAAGGFDERRYGFGGLIELLKACQKDGLIRLERDRRGGLRVFQGPALGRIAPSAPPSPEPAVETIDTGTVETIEPAVVDADSMDVIDEQPIAVVDTTAELLGRAKGKRPARPRLAAPVKARKPAAPKKATGARRAGRGKKAAETQEPDA